MTMLAEPFAVAALPRRKRVLVVDDEPIWRSTLARALSMIGCEVQLASDGKEGLLKLIDSYFELDAVILDLHMPNLDGKALVERIRRQGGDRQVKLFLLSGADPTELSELARPGMANGVFSKLSDFSLLVERLEKEL